jgi:hypothetical protein
MDVTLVVIKIPTVTNIGFRKRIIFKRDVTILSMPESIAWLIVFGIRVIKQWGNRRGFIRGTKHKRLLESGKRDFSNYKQGI